MPRLRLLSCLFVLVACGGSTSTNTDATQSGAGGAAGAGGNGGSAAGAGGAAGAAGVTTGGSAGTDATGTGGSGGMGGTGGTGAAGMGAMCAAPTSTMGPYAVTFQLHNDSPVPIYLWQGCEITHSITACSSGYTDPLVTVADCTAPCGQGSGCANCGACQSAPLTLAPDAVQVISWPGLTYTFESEMSCSCYVEHVAPSGAYRISVSVWDSEPVAGGAMPPPDRVVDHPFALALDAVSLTVELGK